MKAAREASRSLDARERKTLIAIAAILVIALIAMGVNHVLQVYAQEQAAQRRKEYAQQVSETRPLSDALTVTGVGDEGVPSGGTGDVDSYQQYVSWTGTLRFKIEGVSGLYASQHEVTADPRFSKMIFSSPNDFDEIRYFVVTLAVENVDASPNSKSQEGHSWFNFADLMMNVNGSSPRPPFGSDGMPAGGNARTETLYFDLPKGQSMTCHLLFFLTVGEEREDGDLALSIGDMSLDDEVATSSGAGYSAIDLGRIKDMKRGA